MSSLTPQDHQGTALAAMSSHLYLWVRPWRSGPGGWYRLKGEGRLYSQTYKGQGAWWHRNLFWPWKGVGAVPYRVVSGEP